MRITSVLAAAMSAFILSFILTGSVWANPYTEGFVWDRQADWTPGTGGYEGNPDDDQFGNPVWQYEYQQALRAADLDTSDGVTPWYLQPTDGLLYWEYAYNPPNPDRWNYGGVWATPEHFSTNSGGSPTTTTVWVPFVRWINPLDVPAWVSVGGNYSVDPWDGNMSDPGVGDFDFVIAHQSGDASTSQLVYSHYERQLHESDLPIDVTIDSPIRVKVNPGDSIFFSVTSKPDNYYPGNSTMTAVYDNLAITLETLQPKPIDFITAETLDTQFAAGQLSLSDTSSVFIEAPIEETYIGATTTLTASMVADRSSNGHAVADFADGVLAFTDESGQDIVTFLVESLTLEELDNAPNVLAGVGKLTATGGYYVDSFEFGADLVQISFSVDGNLADFQTGFSAVSNITITPVPEPASLSILAAAVALIIRQRNH